MKPEIHKRYLLSNHEVPRIRPKHKDLDNLHYNTTKIDGPQKPFRCAVSEREAGKSTRWLQFYDYNYMNDRTILVLRRQIADVTETYINDIENILNKFSYVPVKLIFKKGDLSNGIIDVYVAEYQKIGEEEHFYNKRLFFRVLGMSNPMSRIKSLMLPKIKYMLFDEFICNIRLGEKYINDEAFKFREIYNTFYRECPDGLICYFFGNPYSVYNPYFEWWGVDTRKIRPGAYINGKNYTIECYQLLPELKQKILEKNPLYQFDDSYRKYAFDGIAINDSHIVIIDKPICCKLKYVFKINKKYYGYYSIPPIAKEYQENNLAFYCEELKWSDSYNRQALCFDFNDLGSNSSLMQNIQKNVFYYLKFSIANNKVGYQKVECEYNTEYLYSKL